MRKHSVRKWLHAILDLLPLFVIPVFAIYSRNENAQFGYEVTQEVNKVVNFNQKMTDTYSSTQSTNGLDFVWEDGILTTSGTATANTGNNRWVGGLTTNHQYALYIENFNSVDNHYIIQMFSTFVRNEYAIFRATSTGGNLQTYIYNGYSLIGTFKPNLFDLTQMGLENATKEQLKEYFPLASYPYTESQEVVIENYETITYNDTDIGSQMIYTLYNTVDKYFNMNKVFNMSAIWNWVNNTMFSGSAPLSAYIVYQIIAYELIMDIIFLLYSVMMFIVDFAEKGIDRFLGRSS